MKKKGFTLIEVIVVISVIALIIPAIYSIIFSILKQQIYLYQLTQVKRQGDTAMNIIKESIKPIVNIVDESGIQLCKDSIPEGDPVLQFIDKNANRFYFYTDPDNKLVLWQQTPNVLTNDKVIISNLSVTCTDTAPAIIKVSFTIRYNTPETINNSLNYTSRTVLRNY